MAEVVKNIELINAYSFLGGKFIDCIGDFTIKLQAPYSKEKVTLLINPNITEYKEKVEPNIRNLIISEGIPETRTIELDFHENNIKSVNVDGKNLEIKLLNISNKKLQGQDFMYIDLFCKQLNK
jgi:hypothetical protein